MQQVVAGPASYLHRDTPWPGSYIPIADADDEKKEAGENDRRLVHSFGSINSIGSIGSIN
jgi:hypothetical protein